MTDFLQRIKDLPQGKLVLLAAQLQERLERLEQAERGADVLGRRDPIAVVGVGCRFPGGADDPESYWELLLEGRDAVGPVPPDRWDGDALYDDDWQAAGKMSSKWGGFLDDIDEFDARLFGVSPREAASMDPQQRLLLEVTWQALERAGIAPGSLFGSRTGVFVGVSATDYLSLQLRRGLDPIDGYLASGAAPSVASGRIAYVLGLNGPTLSLDTACSSSLVAVHLAVQSLRTGQCDAALAGGVNVILSPVTTIALTKAQMLAADGRCKAFSALADGFVRGEGCGVIVLKRLADAQRDHDPIVGVIRGSAVNQDGRSNGLTAPNGPSQEAVIAAALADAGLAPADVGYVEAHGTGTKLGDPIEVQALAAALGRDRAADRRLLIGSVKTNLGHLESAAGIAGLIKSLLILEKGVIPAQRLPGELSPVIPWSQIPVDVATATAPWTAPGPRVAGVSSFGFSGTNAHVLLEAPTIDEEPSAPDRPVEVLALSAQSPEALEQLAQRHAEHLDRHDVSLSDVCATVNTGRDAFPHREAFVASTTAELRSELAARGGGGSPRRSAGGHVQTTRPVRPVFLFTGQGSQYPGMGRELYEHEPVVAGVLDRCDAFLRDRFALPLLDVLHSPDDPRIHETAFTQPALFSLEVALAALWRSWGVEPGAVLGHSVGEYAAAHVAGVLGLEGGLGLVATRGRLMQSVPGDGRMVALMTSADAVAPALAAHADRASIAAVNGPSSIVVSGEAVAVQAVLDAVDGTVERRELEVSHAFHSPAMDAILPAFRAAAAKVTFSPPSVPIISNLTGEEVRVERLASPDHWTQHVRQPVLFGPSIAHLIEKGHTVFLELGPHPALLGMAARSHPEGELRWVASLRRDRSDLREIAAAAAALWANGVAVDWSAWHGPRPGRRPILPTYPLQRQHFWIEGVPAWGSDRASEGPGADDVADLAGLVYEVEWRRQPHPVPPAVAPPDFLAPLADVERRLEATAPELARANGVAAYDELLPDLDELCAAYAVDGLRRLGLPFEVGDRFTFDDVVATGVVDGHHRLLRRLLEMMTEDGWLRAEDGMWVVARAEDDAAPARRSALDGRFEALAAELDLVDRCGTNLPGMLRGETDPLQVLFPGGSTAQMEGIYRASPMARTFNQLLADAVATATAPTPAGRRLRLLEVGAGSGATTDAVLAALGPHEVDYVFTDISAAFTSKARDRYRDDPHVRFGVLDASADPVPQGYAPASFDLIVAANVVHATPDVGTTLSNLRLLLAPGGRLVLLEATTRERFSDLTVGFTPGWWAFADVDRRPDYALLSGDGWRAVLADAGFDAAIVAPGDGEPALRREAVIVASAPDAGTSVDVPGPAQRWVVVGEGALTAAVAASLTDVGDDVTVVTDAARDALQRALEPEPAGIVVVSEPDVRSGDDGEPDDAAAADRALQRRQTSQVLSTVQVLLGQAHPPALWLITQGAQPVADAPLTAPEAAPVWGISHVVELEHPELHCRRIDLEPGPPTTVVGPLVHELHHPDQLEPQSAWRGGDRFVRRLVAARLSTPSPVVLDAEASYLVSGGLRGLGPLVADWLVERGARQLVVFGRHEPDQHTAAAIERWRAKGVIVAVETADAGVDADVRRVVERARALAPIRGVVHAAGTLDDAALLRQDWARFETVYGPKVFGTASLACHLALDELDFLVLFASGVGVGGSAGQANHAAANAYLDAVAHRLRQDGIKAVSIDWGAWARVGAAAERGIDDAPGSFSPEQGLAVLGYAIARATSLDGPPQLLVHSADWSDLAGRFPSEAERSLYRELLTGRPVGSPTARSAGRDATPDGDPAGFLDELLAVSGRRRRVLLQEKVRDLAATVLDVDHPDQIELGQPLHDMGLDSLMAVELRNHLGGAVGAELPATLLFEHPSVTELVDHLLATYLSDAPAANGSTSAPAVSAPEPAPDTSGDDVDDRDADELAAALAARLDRLGPRAP